MLGLANSLMWPAIFPLGIDGLGKFTKTGSAMLVMAISGGAILPLVYGKLALVTGLQVAYAMMVPCYLFILYFAQEVIAQVRHKYECQISYDPSRVLREGFFFEKSFKKISNTCPSPSH
jgi:fucose permease